MLSYRIDLYFLDYRFAIEVDGFNHYVRDIEKESKRQKYIEKKLNCNFIWNDPNENNFNVLKLLIKYIDKFKNHVKDYLINRISKKILVLEFESNHSILSKTFQRSVNNIFSDL